jgi:Trk K+ transport system NAD-binding subunit
MPSSSAFTTQPRGVTLLLSLHLARRLLPPVLVVLGYTTVAALVVRWDMARVGETPRSFGEELYGMYMQVFFEPTEDLPQAPIARFVFWITPIVGAIAIAEGVVKVGAQLLDGDERRALWVQIMSSKMQGHVVVCGLGHVGYRVVQALVKLGRPIVAIEAKDESFLEHVRAMGIPVIQGDARRDDLLAQAGAERARAVVCATDDDLVNLEVAIDSKRMNPDIRVVLRMFDQGLATKVGGVLDLDETFSTSALAAPLVALQATEEGVRSVFSIGDEVHVIAELMVRQGRRTQTVGELETDHAVRVTSVRRGEDGPFTRASRDTEVHVGDAIVVDTLARDLDRVRRGIE